MLKFPLWIIIRSSFPARTGLAGECFFFCQQSKVKIRSINFLAASPLVSRGSSAAKKVPRATIPPARKIPRGVATRFAWQLRRQESTPSNNPTSYQKSLAASPLTPSPRKFTGHNNPASYAG